jgi:hypothetical protein
LGEQYRVYMITFGKWLLVRKREEYRGTEGRSGRSGPTAADRCQQWLCRRKLLEEGSKKPLSTCKYPVLNRDL